MEGYDPLVVATTKMFHQSYESHAHRNGWETQAASRVHWDDVPEENKRTMLDMMSECLPAVLSGVALGIEGVADQMEKETPHSETADGMYFAAAIVRGLLGNDVVE